MKEILERLLRYDTLSEQECCNLLLGIAEKQYSDSSVAALLSLLEMRGVTVDELIGFRNGLMQTRIPVDLSGYRAIDIVGTGGDGKNTFNISTASAFVLAGAGYKVAKHGNYGATSVSGASNVLEHHGVKYTTDNSILLHSLEESGVMYLHAALFNPAMKVVAPIRKALKIRTIFNLLGPLVNPADPPLQLLGVANLEQMRLYTQTLSHIGKTFAVVTSMDGYDEISLTSDFKISTNHTERIYSPSDFGFAPISPSDLYGGTSIDDASRIFDDVLCNRASESQIRCVVMNAGAAIHVIHPEKNISDCLAEASESIKSGKAASAFKKFLEINH